MASKPQPLIESPALSVPFTPLIKRAHRESIGSLSGIPRVDKDALSQALDEIHNTASQSETLTTFNEFTTPPSSSTNAESKGIAGELQGGLTGLYNRLKASVSGARDTHGVISSTGEAGGGSMDDGSSTKSLAKPEVNSPKYTNPVSPTSIAGFESATRVQSPLGGISGGGGSSKHSGQVSIASTVAFASTFGDLKSSLPSPTTVKSSFTPLAQATPSTLAIPALNQVNVSAISNMGMQNSEPAGNNNQKANKSSPSIVSVYVKDESAKAGIEQMNSDDRFGQSGTQSSDRSHTRDPIFQYPSTAQSSYSMIDNTGVAISRSRDFNSNTQKEASLTEKKGTGLGSTGTSVFDGPQENKAMPKITPDVDSPLHKSKGCGVGKQTGNFPSNSKIQHPDHEHNDSLPHLRITHSSANQQAQSSDFTVSRTCSSDTVRTDLSNIPRDAKSHLSDASESPGLQILDPIVSKSSATIQATSNPRNINVMLSQVKGRVLSKEYWMRDENARDCFHCGDPFSTFRRKHHCSMYHRL